MARIKTVKYRIHGILRDIGLNCRSNGEFTCKLPEEIKEAFDIHRDLSASTLQDLEKELAELIDRYRNAKTKSELMIGIQYKSGGRYNRDKDGKILHPETWSDRFHDSGSSLTFDYEIFIMETVDTVVNWYHTRKGDPESIFDDRKDEDPEKYYKSNKEHRKPEYTMIPYTDEALTKLEQNTEVIRKTNEVIHQFIDQDENKIIETLLNQKLLTV